MKCALTRVTAEDCEACRSYAPTHSVLQREHAQRNHQNCLRLALSTPEEAPGARRSRHAQRIPTATAAVAGHLQRDWIARDKAERSTEMTIRM